MKAKKRLKESNKNLNKAMQFIEPGYIDDPDYPLDIKAVWSGILSLDPKVLDFAKSEMQAARDHALETQKMTFDLIKSQNDRLLDITERLIDKNSGKANK